MLVPAASRFDHPRGEVNKNWVLPAHGTVVQHPRGLGVPRARAAVSGVLPDARRVGLALGTPLWYVGTMHSHGRHTDTEDEAACLVGPSDRMSEALARECEAFRRACSALDRGAGPWKLDFTPAAFPRPRHGAFTSCLWRQSLADALFFVLMGAIVGYAMLLASGTLYRGKPDMVDTIRWRMWRDGRMAHSNAPGRKDETMGGDPIARLLPTGGGTVTLLPQTTRTACSTSA